MSILTDLREIGVNNLNSKAFLTSNSERMRSFRLYGIRSNSKGNSLILFLIVLDDSSKGNEKWKLDKHTYEAIKRKLKYILAIP